MLLELPCGFIDESGSWVKEVEMEEMSGFEEDILADASKSRSGIIPLNEILARCIRRIGTVESPVLANERERAKRVPIFLPIIKKMMLGDRALLLIRMRQASLGDMFEPRINCPSCKEEFGWSVDLSVIPLIPMKDENGNPTPPKDVYETTLPSGKQATWKHLRVSDEQTQMRAAKEKGSELLSYMIYLRMLTINGEKVSNPEAVKGLSTRDRNFLRKEFDEKGGGMDQELLVECPSLTCRTQWSVDLPVAQKSFFFPSGIR